jgi:hypothetical protein
MILGWYSVFVRLPRFGHQVLGVAPRADKVVGKGSRPFPASLFERE